MKNFTKLLLLICGIFLNLQISKAQSIAVGIYNCAGAGTQTLSVVTTAGITAYSWRNASNAVVGTTASVTLPSGTYTVIYTKAGVNTTLGPITVIAGIVPTAASVTPASVSAAICGSTTQTLTSTVAANYIWTRDGVDISGATASTYGVSGNSVTTPGTYLYAVKVTNPTTLCTASSNAVSVKVSPKPATPTINPVSPNLLCGSDTKILTATGGGATYTWKRGTTVLGSTINTYTASGTETTAGTYNYTVSYANAVGCSSDDSAPVALVLSPKPATPVISPATLTTPICGVATQVLTVAAGVSSYFWKRNGTGITGATNSITVTGTDVATPGTYAYSVSSQDAVGCASDESSAVNLKVSPKPTTPVINPVSPNILCGTDTKVLTATGGGTTYTWRRESTVLGSVINTYTATGTETSLGTYNYTVFYVNSADCPSDVSAPVALLLSPRPATPTIINNGLLTFCEGGFVTLTSSYIANTNIWSRAAGGDTTTTNADGIIIRTTNTLSVKARDANGCTSLSSLPIIITVNLKPSPPVIDFRGARGVCEADSIVLTSDNKGSGIYRWNNNKITRSITVKDAGNYTLTYTDTQTPACTSLASQATVVTINPLPVKPIIASISPTEFCYRQFTTLRASSTTTGATFEWDYQNRTGSQIDVSGSAKLTTVETIKISAKSVATFANNPKVCKSKDASDIVTITVNPLPITPSISANGPLTFCPDSTVTLTSTDSPNGVYKWINARDNSEFSNNKAIVIDTTSKFFSNTLLQKVGKFYVRTISDKSCVSDTSRNVTITVRNAPQPASITADPRSATVCSGGKVTLTALIANVNIAKYSWRDESNLQEVSTQPEVSVITSGTFSVKVRDVFGCFAAYSKPIRVSINSLPTKPTLTLIKPKVFCDEDSVVVQSSLASTTPNGNRTLYTWIVDGQEVLKSFSRSFSYKRVGVISVALTDSNGCKAAAVSDTIRTTVNPLPNSPTITVRGANPFCADKNVALNAAGVNGVTYRWSTGAITQTITTNTAGNITVQAVNGFGCLSKPSQPVLIRVNQLPEKPTLSVNNNAATVFCDGDKVRITASSKTVFKDTYWWRSTTDSIGRGEDLNSISASKSGSYFAKVEDNNGCISLASAPIAIDSKPNPTPTIIKQIGSFTLDAQGVGDENGYFWRYNGDLQKDLTTRLIKAKKDGDYQVQASISYTGVNGKLVCYSKVSDAIKYVQDLTFEGFSIFPNPSQDGTINVEVLEDLIGAKIIVYDNYGRNINEYTVDKFNALKKIELPDFHGTTYYVKIISGGYEKIRKVLIY